MEIYAVNNSQLVTLKVHGTDDYMKFQLDKGIQCHVVPLYVYVRATGDNLLDCQLEQLFHVFLFFFHINMFASIF